MHECAALGSWENYATDASGCWPTGKLVDLIERPALGNRFPP